MLIVMDILQKIVTMSSLKLVEERMPILRKSKNGEDSEKNHDRQNMYINK